jgi:hypothetical protein
MDFWLSSISLNKAFRSGNWTCDFLGKFGGVNQEILYDDYRTVNGVKLPHHIELHRGGDKYDMNALVTV